MTPSRFDIASPAASDLAAAAGGCADFASSVSRRTAIRAAIGVAAGLAVTTAFGEAFVETAYATGGKADRMLVVLSLRGGADGMSLVVPHGDAVYYEARPDIAIPKDKLLAANSFFGLHPLFEPLLPMWNAGRIAAIHATGQQVTTRSHFAAMEEVEDADPGSPQRVGWLNRMISLRGEGVSDTTALQMGTPALATHLVGPSPALAAGDLSGLSLYGPGGDHKQAWESSLSKLWSNAPGSVASGGARAIAVAQAYSPAVSAAASSVSYPSGDLGKALQSTAKVLKSDVGAEVVTIDQGAWDHHEGIGNLSSGNMKRVLDPLAQGLAAFFTDLGALADKVTVVTISEFGRRVRQNAARGLDHGHGNVMLVLGGGVKGGYYGRWPGLENTQDSDLPITSDYRDVLSEVVAKLYPERSLASIFPGFSRTPLGFMVGSTGHIEESEETVEPTKTDPKALPASFFKSYGSRKGTALIGMTLTAPAPTLKDAGKKAGVRVAYRWETVVGKKVNKHTTKRTFKIPASYAGRRLRVKVTYSASGYTSLTKVFDWGEVQSKPAPPALFAAR
ncbi:MAG: DUF1501 domain-containing protein [Leucobacter sp.]